MMSENTPIRGVAGTTASPLSPSRSPSGTTASPPSPARSPSGTTASSPSSPPSINGTTAGTPSYQKRNPQLYRACQEFESLFILQLWRAMQRTLPSQPKTLNYTEMFDVQFADHLAKHGRFGLAEQLYEQLSRHLPKEPTP